jgi:hypothetical protein
VVAGVIIDPTSGEEVAITACSEEHLQTLVRTKRTPASPDDD